MKTFDMLLSEFEAYAVTGGVMPEALAIDLKSLHSKPSFMVNWITRVHGPASSVSAVEGWTIATKQLVSPSKSVIDIHLVKGYVTVLETWLDMWTQAVLSKDQLALQAWTAVSPRLIPVSVALFEALSGSELTQEKVHSEIGRQMRLSIRGAAKGPNKENLELARLWIELSVQADCSSSSSKALSDELLLMTHDPSSWQVASLLCVYGAKISPGMEPCMRQWINCALSQHVNSPSKDISAKERVHNVQTMLGSTGRKINCYEDRSGEPFDSIAMEALWVWSNNDLAVELVLAGLVWSSKSKKRVPALARQVIETAQKVSPQQGEDACRAALNIIDAVCEQSGMGLFSIDWCKLVQSVIGRETPESSALSTTEIAWAESLARWGQWSDWTPDDWASISKTVVSWVSGCPALASATESAGLLHVSSPMLKASEYVVLQAKIRL